MRTSNHLIGVLNFLTFLLSIPILGGGIWLSSRANNTDCLKFLQWPLIIIVLIGFIIFAYVVTDKGEGRRMINRGYLDYYLDDYSGWLKDRVKSDEYWGKISSCIRDSKTCRKLARNFNGVPETSDMFFERKLSPIQKSI
ncbi:hypothetical protein TSUD_97130 [Trifolium subterraneum]|nr:hypothetical protein TSUD_97130 [Trifolium subterraneum]